MRWINAKALYAALSVALVIAMIPIAHGDGESILGIGRAKNAVLDAKDRQAEMMEMDPEAVKPRPVSPAAVATPAAAVKGAAVPKNPGKEMSVGYIIFSHEPIEKKVQSTLPAPFKAGDAIYALICPNGPWVNYKDWSKEKDVAAAAARGLTMEMTIRVTDDPGAVLTQSFEIPLMPRPDLKAKTTPAVSRPNVRTPASPATVPQKESSNEVIDIVPQPDKRTYKAYQMMGAGGKGDNHGAGPVAVARLLQGLKPGKHVVHVKVKVAGQNYALEGHFEISGDDFGKAYQPLYEKLLEKEKGKM
ncbi:MAG: hypothetical protein NTX50_26395 [Candidatus Sumerlaeota bacterium]|nr:hypothetical protein [Candidatus Sumerlaeota bacterium]